MALEAGSAVHEFPPGMGLPEESATGIDLFWSHSQGMGSGTPARTCLCGTEKERHPSVMLGCRSYAVQCFLLFGGWSGLAEDAVEVCATNGALALGHPTTVGLDDLASGVALCLALHAVEVARVRLAGLYRLCHLSMSPVSFLAALCGTGLVSP